MEWRSFLIHRKLWKPKELLFATCGREWYDLSKNIWIPFVYDAKTNTITEMNVMTDDYLQYLDLL